MKLTLGFSPCPNDTFIFDALVNGKIDTGGIGFDVVLEDVETLNQWALEGRLDITKLSFPAFFRAADTYILLNTGSALGKGVGPLLVKKKGAEIESLAGQTILIPGMYTTANLLLAFAYPDAQTKQPLLFSEIEDAVLTGKAPMGVLIHENRFTYAQRGLEKITDLGTTWEEKMQLPVPLGGIAIKRSADPAIASRVEALIRQSLQHAWARYPELPSYVKEHAQEMDPEVMRRHIELYVNGFSENLGDAGRTAILGLKEVFDTIHPGTTAPRVNVSLFSGF